MKGGCHVVNPQVRTCAPAPGRPCDLGPRREDRAGVRALFLGGPGLPGVFHRAARRAGRRGAGGVPEHRGDRGGRRDAGDGRALRAPAQALEASRQQRACKPFRHENRQVNLERSRGGVRLRSTVVYRRPLTRNRHAPGSVLCVRGIKLARPIPPLISWQQEPPKAERKGQAPHERRQHSRNTPNKGA